MPRTKKERCIHHNPKCTLFKPCGIPSEKIQKIEIFLDEYEAIRLADLEGMNMEEGAKHMNISPATFYRILHNGRKKIAEAIVHSKAIHICKHQK